jgi:hypothetical protein
MQKAPRKNVRYEIPKEITIVLKAKVSLVLKISVIKTDDITTIMKILKGPAYVRKRYMQGVKSNENKKNRMS